MGMTLELPNELADAVRKEARRLGKDPAQLAIEQMTNFYAVAANTPEHTDPKRFRPFSAFMTELGEKCGYPNDWRTSTPPPTDDDAIAIESAFREMYDGNGK